MKLFSQKDFVMHSGTRSTWKIDCDALSDTDITCIASVLAPRIGPFSEVEGVPRGGLRLAEALSAYKQSKGGLLIVDDVCTTGNSLEEHRAGRDAKGVVIFARGSLPPWTQALFVTIDASEARALAAEAALDLANQRIAALRRELGVALDENKALTIDDAKYSQTSRGKLEAENARLRAALKTIVERTESWNASVEAIIGRVPNTGIYLEEAKLLLGR